MKKIGLCHGTFDPLDYGHMRMFESVKKMCDHLIVSVTADEFVNQGIERPTMSEQERSFMVLACRFVDGCEILNERSALTAIVKWKPSVYMNCNDSHIEEGRGYLEMEYRAVERFGGDLFVARAAKRVVGQGGLRWLQFPTQ